MKPEPGIVHPSSFWLPLALSAARLIVTLAGATTMPSKSPEQQLAGFLDKFTPEVASRARAARAKMRKLLPGAVELVYDNYNALAIGFGPTERASDAIFSIAVYPRWVSLFFLKGAKLSDPQKLLKGSGNKVRHIVLENLAILDKPAVRELIAQALENVGEGTSNFELRFSGRRSKVEDRSSGYGGRHRLVIKSISAKQRPRRPPAGEW